MDPNNKILVPFLTAFAKAAASMPSLKEAALWSPLKFCAYDVSEYDDFDYKQVAHEPEYELAWGLVYARPYTQAFIQGMGEDSAPFRQIWWYTGRWQPNSELLGLFQQIGC